MTIDYGQMVMDNEFAKMIKYVVQGIPVNDETLAVDVIHEVGVGKDFLSHENTYKHMKTQSQPKLIDRRTREDWYAGGQRDMHQRALAEARYILENHKNWALVRNRFNLIIPRNLLRGHSMNLDIFYL